MGRLQVGMATVLILASTSYAWAQVSTEGPSLGGVMPKATARGSSPAPDGFASPANSGARVGKVVTGLKAQGRAATRGALEVKVYQAASPAVVLVVSDDMLGSGVLISADGKIITNLHVVGAAKEVGVVFKPKVEGAEVGDADVRTAKVLRRDEVADLALLQVEPPPGVTPLVIGDSSKIEVGADVHAIGHPTGESWTYTRGIVSQVRKDYAWRIEDGLARKATVIQTQTPINPGNSGGPLIADDLTIVGINSFKGEGEGMNFAVSAEDVKAFLARDADRLSEQARNIPENCELTIVSEKPSKDPAGIYYFMDEDCDGAEDFMIFEPKRKRDAHVYIFDDDRNGVIDAMLYDDDRDGDFESALYDTDGDGVADLSGKFRDGEDEPYMYEKLKK